MTYETKETKQITQRDVINWLMKNTPSGEGQIEIRAVVTIREKVIRNVGGIRHWNGDTFLKTSRQLWVILDADGAVIEDKLAPAPSQSMELMTVPKALLQLARLGKKWKEDPNDPEVTKEVCAATLKYLEAVEEDEVMSTDEILIVLNTKNFINNHGW